MIRNIKHDEIETITKIINDSATLYMDVIPYDQWHDPYIYEDDVQKEFSQGVKFYCMQKRGNITAVMGVEELENVILIRHLYVRSILLRTGIGTKLLEFLLSSTKKPVLTSTWKGAVWAVKFFENNGFVLLPQDEKNEILKVYWNMPDVTIKESAVLSYEKWAKK